MHFITFPKHFKISDHLWQCLYLYENIEIMIFGTGLILIINIKFEHGLIASLMFCIQCQMTSLLLEHSF